jgi:WD40 repeat protein/tRNA A-37 threonylcarbamoyl transferase component Bud32
MSEEPDIALPSTSDGPKQFADYELVGEIARGGMGVVYRARQPKLKRTVALKLVLAGAFAGDEEIKRFHLEAEASANLDHPNIVPVYEVGQHAGHHYLSMKLIEGSSLADQLEAFKADQRKTAEFMITIARAMHHAHQRGVLHRDLKPDNILIDNEARPYITDFGLAKHVDQDSGMTQTGAIMGTPTYMAPEQARGERNLTTSVDVYSLGAILYEMLTGRPPFQADTMTQLLIAAQREEPKRPRTINQKVDLDMETIALRCLSKEPENRYASAAAMADDLQRWLKGETIIARPVGSVERAVRWCKRNTALAGTAGVAVSLIALISLIFVAQLVIKNKQLSESMAGEKEARANAESARNTAEESAILAKLQEDIAKEQTKLARAETLKMRRHLYAANMNQVATAWQTADLPRVLALLEAQRPTTDMDKDLRDWEWKYWHAQAHAYSKRWNIELHGPDSVSALARSSDGTKLLALVAPQRGDMKQLVLDPQTGKHSPGATFPARQFRRTLLADNGEAVAMWRSYVGRGQSAADLQLSVYGKDGKLVRTQKDIGLVASANFSPRGTHLAMAQSGDPAIGGFTQAVRILNIKTGHIVALKGTAPLTIAAGGVFKTVAQNLPHGGSVHQLAFNPDATILATGANDGTLRLWDTATGEMRHERNLLKPISRIAFSPDGAMLAVTDHRNTALRLWRVTDASLIAELKGIGDQQINRLAFSPDGKHVAAGGLDRSIRVWSIADRDRRVFRGHQSDIRQLVFIANDRFISLGADNEILEWDLGAPENPRQLELGGTGWRIQIDFTVDSSHFAVHGPYWKTWDLSTGESSTTSFNGRGSRGSVHLRTTPTFVTVPDGRSKLVVVNRDGSERHSFPIGHKDFVVSVSIHPDGKQVLTSSQDGVMKIWDMATGKLLVTGKSFRGVHTAAFNGNGGRVLVYSRNHIVDVWTPKTNRVMKLAGNGLMTNAVSDPTGDLIAVATEQKHVTFFDAETGVQVRRIETGNAMAIAFHPDNTRMATAHGNDGVKVWDLHTGQEVLSFLDPASKVERVWFSPDGRHLISVDYHCKIKVWSIE